MKAMQALLSSHEEAALRKIGLGSIDILEPAHVRRLVQLELIEWHGGRWHLTAIGRQRYDALVVDWCVDKVASQRPCR